MATATQQNAPKVIRGSLELENVAFFADPPIILPALDVYDTARPVGDAQGSKSNDELAKIAEKKQPPISWYDREEEQLF